MRFPLFIYSFIYLLEGAQTPNCHDFGWLSPKLCKSKVYAWNASWVMTTLAGVTNICFPDETPEWRRHDFPPLQSLQRHGHWGHVRRDCGHHKHPRSDEIHSGSVRKNGRIGAGSSSPWCSCQRMNSIPHLWWFFQGAGNSKSWGPGRWFLDFLIFQVLQPATYWGFDDIFEAQLKLPGTSHFETSKLEPPEFVLQPSTHVCSIWHCRKFLIIPLAIFKGPNICHMLPQSNGLHWISDVNGQTHVPSGKLT